MIVSQSNCQFVLDVEGVERIRATEARSNRVVLTISAAFLDFFSRAAIFSRASDKFPSLAICWAETRSESTSEVLHRGKNGQ